MAQVLFFFIQPCQMGKDMVAHLRRCFLQAVFLILNDPYNLPSASKGFSRRTCSGVGAGVGRGCKAKAKWAILCASSLSVFARSPLARAKSRTLFRRYQGNQDLGLLESLYNRLFIAAGCLTTTRAGCFSWRNEMSCGIPSASLKKLHRLVSPQSAISSFFWRCRYQNSVIAWCLHESLRGYNKDSPR